MSNNNGVKMTTNQLIEEIIEYYSYYKECCEDAETTPIATNQFIERMVELLSHCIESQVELIAYNEE